MAQTPIQTQLQLTRGDETIMEQGTITDPFAALLTDPDGPRAKVGMVMRRSSAHHQTGAWSTAEVSITCECTQTLEAIAKASTTLRYYIPQLLEAAEALGR